MNKRRNRRVYPALLGLLMLAALALGAYVLWERPPRLEPQTQLRTTVSAAPQAEETLARRAEAPASGRKPGVYTLLLVGNDDGNGNTDTILLGRMDTLAHKLDLVSIPRDTLVNRDWRVRKLNAVYAGTAGEGGVAIDGLRQELCKLCGFTPDVYAVVDLEVFIDAVDLIGGVDFDLPLDMDFDNYEKNQHVHLKAGPHHLDGLEAMCVVRYRSNYINGDLDRVQMQQDFVKAALGQLLSLGQVPRLPELVAMIAERTDSDLTAANIAWLTRQLLQCKSEDIHLYTMPNIPVTLQDLSYVVADLEPWLQILNENLNPYYEPVTADNLDLVYREFGVYRATSGVLQGAAYYD
ncbi:MAG: LCP family protein [Oscillospiraceae bacterium]|nr:LCP family protein [Oscillospiraceae bacterium]